MANTTFKGPVRSQNGFQELVDGVWTPVGGGGGGGGGSTAIVYTTPSDGSTVTVQLPAPTEVGTMYTVAGLAAVFGPSGQIKIIPTLLPGQTGAAFLGLSMTSNDGGGVFQASGEEFYIQNVANQNVFRIIYTGIFAGEIAIYSIEAYNTYLGG